MISHSVASKVLHDIKIQNKIFSQLNEFSCSNTMYVVYSLCAWDFFLIEHNLF